MVHSQRETGLALLPLSGKFTKHAAPQLLKIVRTFHLRRSQIHYNRLENEEIIDSLMLIELAS